MSKTVIEIESVDGPDGCALAMRMSVDGKPWTAVHSVLLSYQAPPRKLVGGAMPASTLHQFRGVDMSNGDARETGEHMHLHASGLGD